MFIRTISLKLSMKVALEIQDGQPEDTLKLLNIVLG